MDGSIRLGDGGGVIDLAARSIYRERMAQLQTRPIVDWTGCPEVEVVIGKVSGVPILRHSRMPADAILENYRSGLPADEIAEVFQLPAEGVRRLLAYAAKQNLVPKP